ncbi:HET-domain-containing protein [Apiospora kogelbergensis]|uniref:HET-domain-containing protein n=1 Tax=Apiospora kogelbergensis TaxID=1337665 RepID=A0AAW0Q808_9PEZI
MFSGCLAGVAALVRGLFAARRLRIPSDPSPLVPDATTGIPYKSLNPKKSEIRLLTLLPASSNIGDRVCCSLKVASLNKKPKYEALSYVWGDRNQTSTIIVDGAPFEATINLEAALRHLQRPDAKRVLWVDAVCINQQDRLERNVQVPMMSRIYKGARLVVIWLGQGNPNIEQFFFFVNASTLSHLSFGTWIDQFSGRDIVPKSAFRNVMGNARAMRGINNLWSLPYWNRMWTFQELYLARDDPLCVYGDLTLQLETILEGNLRIDEGFKIINEFHGWSLNALDALQGDIQVLKRKIDALKMNMQVSEENAQALKRDIEALGDGIQSEELTDGRETFDLKQSARTLASITAARDHSYKRDLSLARFFTMTAGRECLEPQDKIYALYGCAPRAQEIYPVDYSKSMAQVCLETTSYIVNVERVPSIYMYFGALPSRPREISYPSWALDFQNAHPFNVVWAKRRLAAPLCDMHERWQWTVSTDLTTMHMRARNVGSCQVFLRLATDPIEIIRQILALSTSTGELRTSLAPKYDRIRNIETLCQRIFRVVAAYFGIGDLPSTEIEDAFNEIAQASGSESDVVYSECAREVLQDVARLAGEVFFMTERGCFGLGFSGIQDDDVVTLPPAAVMPIILRKETNRIGETGRQYYRMVGVAFVDGVCTDEAGDFEPGKFTDPDLIREVEQMEPELFVIH